MTFGANLVGPLRTNNSKTPPSIIPLQTDGTTVFGRSSVFCIADRRVSRKHAEIIVSSASKSVTIRALSVNPTTIIRKGQQVQLEKDLLFELNDGDKISLLHGVYEYNLQIYNDADSKELEDCSEDATQLDLDALEELERRNAMSITSSKRFRSEEDTNSTFKRLKLANDAFRPPMAAASSAVLINPAELDFVRTVGTGSCGEVFEAKWRGTRVAVKKIFRTLLHGNHMREFQLESDMLRRLRHPCIVLFMGTVTQGSDTCIVTEYIDRGSLHDVLRDESIKLDWSTILNMAIDAAKGMNYLHTYSPPIIHRDLKSYNLLVDNNFRVKVSDFGLAKFQADDEKETTFCGTLPWTAPEIFNNVGYSAKCDIYSFGIVLWELLTREEPYHGYNKPDIIVGVSKQSLRPTIPATCPPKYRQLIQDCWLDDPTKRPTFAEILHRLEEMDRDHKQSFSLNNNNSNTKEPITLPTPMNLSDEFKSFSEKVTGNYSWELDPRELEFSAEIAEGTSATVYKGNYRNQAVAIKVLKESVDGKHQTEFKKELEVISTLRSPYIVLFFGATLKPHLSIVTELLPNSLYDIMIRPDIKYDWELVFKLTIESANAISTLHNWKPPVVHRDLKPQNLLVDAHWGVKVADLGLARFFTPENQDSLANVKGTYLYAAPEVYNGSPHSAKSDVYSYGIILWELVTRCVNGTYVRPYSEHKNLKFEFQTMIQVAKHGLRPVLHSACPAPFAALMQRCWSAEALQRPDINEVVQQLESIKTLFEQEQRNRSN